MSTQDAGHDPDRTQLLATRTSSTVAPIGDALTPGERLGRYRIEAMLGRGGMGEVYRAEQLEPVRRTVALKLLRSRRLDARHLAHFEIERQLLAQMRHPAIAQIYDADTTADGCPFFAMEFIAGSPLTQFCDEHALSLRQRIELLIRICEGVQHAHQKGVIHRDLKPGNLLVDQVDGRALPKIIDFGIATASSMTQDREIAGTPDYMSPEQAGGDPSRVDTRSDVYSLGVVLHEVLTGQRPDAVGETQTADTRTLRLPSQQLATLSPADASQVARRQGLRVASMQRLLRHELDWIVAKAMRHDRSDRYASAAALAEDLQRFLDGKPVQAVPSTRVYVWGKFMRRHRVALLAASFALLALLAGLAVSVYGLMQARAQRAIAEQRSGELEKVAAFQQSMLQGVDIEAMGIGMAEGLHQQLLKATPADRAALTQVLGHVSTADIARGLIDRNILTSAEAAIERDFSGEPGLAADLRESVARVRSGLGLDEAAAVGFGQVADYRSGALGKTAPATLRARQQQASALLLAAQPKPALALLQRSLQDAAALAPDDPLRIKLQMHEAEAIAGLGDRQRARKMLEALTTRSTALRGERDPTTMDVVNSLAILLGRMGEAKLGRRYMERLMPARSAVLGAEHDDTLDAIGNLAVMRVMTGDVEGALLLQRRLVGIHQRRLGKEHPKTLGDLGNLANMLTDAGELQESLEISLSVLEARTRVLGIDHPQTLRSKLNLSTLYARLHQFDKTLPLQREVIEARTRLLGARHPDTLYILINHAGSLAQAGQFKDSLALASRILPQAVAVLGAHHPQTLAAMQIIADDASDLGDTAFALASYQRLLDARENAMRGEGQAMDARVIDAAWQMEGLLRERNRSAEADAMRTRYVTPLLTARADALSPSLVRMAENIRETERRENQDAARRSR